MRRWNLKAAALCAPLLVFASALDAAPIYNVTAGTLTYVNSYLGSGLGDTFSFTGPQPVSVQGGGATAVAYSGLQSLGVGFNLTLNLVIDDTGNESGPASANGINYGGSQYTGGALLMNTSSIVLTAGHLTVSVPATVSGQLNVCEPDASCPGGTNPFDVSFGPLNGVLTVTFAQFNLGSTYTLTNAQFVTSSGPEPATWLLFSCGLGGLYLARRKKSMASQ